MVRRRTRTSGEGYIARKTYMSYKQYDYDISTG
jgi:hypothetical protein